MTSALITLLIKGLPCDFPLHSMSTHPPEFPFGGNIPVHVY